MRVKLVIIGALFLFGLSDRCFGANTGQFSTYFDAEGRLRGTIPSYTSTMPNGAPVVHTPGQPLVFGTPTPNGGYAIQQPGRQPTYINPN
jgi:hypothetical protein